MRTHRTNALTGAEARRFLRQRTGRQRAVLSGRGSAALWASLRALGLRDAPVLIPANTCYIVLWAVLHSGNVPVLADIDPQTGSVTPETLSAAGVARPGAVIPAHMYGIPAPMRAISDWARQHNVAVIEDAALTIGTQADGMPVGAWGDVSIFSFGRGKPADMDNGGAALTDDAELANHIDQLTRELPLWGPSLQQLNRQWLDLYWAMHQHEADNPALAALYAPLFDLYGPITRYRLPDAAWRAFPDALAGLDASAGHRATLAALYDTGLRDTPTRTLSRPDDAVMWRYPLCIPADQRDRLLAALWEAGALDVTRWYPSLQPMRAALAADAPASATPHADQLAAEIINLPLTAETTVEEARRITDLIRRYFDEA